MRRKPQVERLLKSDTLVHTPCFKGSSCLRTQIMKKSINKQEKRSKKCRRCPVCRYIEERMFPEKKYGKKSKAR